MKALVLSILLVFTLEARVKSSSGDTRFSTQQQAEDFTEEADSFSDFEDEFSEEERFDPLEPYNRWMTSVNDSIYHNALKPAIKGYNYVIPQGGRESVNKFFNNLYYPVSFTNNLLQFKLKHAGEETVRFLINSTVGLLGFFDPATSWLEIDTHVEDFGQTLGHYGVGSGFPVVLPFFGQRNLRDLMGTFADTWVDPIYHVENRFYNTVEPYWASVAIAGYDDFNEYSLTPEAYEKLTNDSIDLYPLLRDSYEQYRDAQIKE